MRFFKLFILMCLVLASCRRDEAPQNHVPKVLLFTKTSGYRHESINAGVSMFQSHQSEWGIEVTETADSKYFTAENLAKYKLVILLSTTGNLFTNDEKLALQSFVRAGGSILAIHAATDAEYNWPWYGQMIGGWFDNHPDIQQAMCEVQVAEHPSVKEITTLWIRTDEWYNFKLLQPDNNVVITVDEQTYTGGTHGNLHPISWYRNFEGGKVFYTAMGHTNESYGEPQFISHIKGAIFWLLN